MNITPLIEEFARKRTSPSTLFDMKTARNLLTGDGPAALVNQDQYDGDSEFLPIHIKASVKSYARNKDIAIHIYKHLIDFLRRKGVEVEVAFPPVSISNTFERLMFIAKYLQDPRHKVADLPDILWVSDRTIEEDMKRLRGDHEDPIQICGKVFKVEDMERSKGTVHFPSTAHPLFLTPNLTQVLVTLKGLRAMAENPLYQEYAWHAAADIWEQLSDYAKTRIHFVLAEIVPEDLSWYESLRKDDEEYFYSEVRCSQGNNILDCMKNDKPFHVEYDGDEGVCIYDHCTFVPHTYSEDGITVDCTQGRVRLIFDKVIRTSYSAEGLI